MAEETAVNNQITDAVAPQSESGASPVGRFVWHDLTSPDMAKSQRYYSDLLGWTYKEFDTGDGNKYQMIHAGGTEWGGFMPFGPEPNAPAQWISYVTVADVDAATAAAERLGGRVVVPGTDIPTVGRFAIIESRSGAWISPFKPSTPGESPTPAAAPGTFVWHELLAKDPENDRKFFSEIFGWRVEEVPMGEMGTYYLFKRLDNGKDAGGMMPKPEGDPGPSAWLPYVQVESADATAARVSELGGKVHVQPADIPGIGRFTVTADPDGALIAFLQPPAA